MDWFEALVLGLVQGLTEFLPVSSSGHLTIGKALFGIESSDLLFEVAVHAATVCSTIVVFRKEIADLLCGLFRFKYNEQTKYIAKIAVSLIPVMIVGLFFKDEVEAVFGSGLVVVGAMLLLTALLLFLSDRITKRHNARSHDLAFRSQAFPGGGLLVPDGHHTDIGRGLPFGGFRRCEVVICRSDGSDSGLPVGLPVRSVRLQVHDRDSA